MTLAKFKASAADAAPPHDLTAPLAALWWDLKGDWTRAHALVDELETTEGMAVHAYLHRKEGVGVECRLLVRPRRTDFPSTHT